MTDWADGAAEEFASICINLCGKSHVMDPDVQRLLALSYKNIRAKGIEDAAELVDPKPGPEPRDFQDHRIRMGVRRYLAAEIRNLK